MFITCKKCSGTRQGLRNVKYEPSPYFYLFLWVYTTAILVLLMVLPLSQDMSDHQWCDVCIKFHENQSNSSNVIRGGSWTCTCRHGDISLPLFKIIWNIFQLFYIFNLTEGRNNLCFYFWILLVTITGNNSWVPWHEPSLRWKPVLQDCSECMYPCGQLVLLTKDVYLCTWALTHLKAHMIRK